MNSWLTAGFPCQQVRDVIDSLVNEETKINHLAYLGAAGHTGVKMALTDMDLPSIEPRAVSVVCPGDNTCRKYLSLNERVSMLAENNPAVILDDQFLIWDNKWTVIDRSAFDGIVLDTEYWTREYKYKFLAQAYIDKMPHCPDVTDGILAMTNGMVNLQDGSFEKHSKRVVPARITGVEFDSSAQCPRFLNEYLPCFTDGEADVQEFFRSLMKHILYGGNVYEKFLILYGTQNTGKTTFVQICSQILGTYATALQPVALCHATKDANAASSALYALKNRRLAVVEEPDGDSSLFDASIVKQITGLSTLAVRGLWKAQETITFGGIMIIPTNRSPKFADDVEGIERRVIFYRVPELQVPKDSTLKDEILKNELPGIVNWILGGADWDGSLPQSIQESTDDYNQHASMIRIFIDECCELVSYREGSTKTDLYDAFQMLCIKTRGGKPIQMQRFVEGLSRFGYDFRKGDRNYTARLRVKDDYSL